MHDYVANQASSVSRRTYMSSWHPRVRVCTIDKKKRPNSLIRARRANILSGEESLMLLEKKKYRASEQTCEIFVGDRLIHEIKDRQHGDCTRNIIYLKQLHPDNSTHYCLLR